MLYLVRRLERHRAAEAQSEAAFDEMRGLLVAAVERVRDAARHLDAAQAGQHRVGRAPHVHQHRQSGAPRDLELLAVEMLLARPDGDQRGLEQVDADLADGHQARVALVILQGLLEALEILVGRVAHAQRMDAQRVREPVLVRERAHDVEVEDAHGRDHLHRDARRIGARDDRGAIGVELAGVEVAVGVDPPRRSGIGAHRVARQDPRPEPRLRLARPRAAGRAGRVRAATAAGSAPRCGRRA